jgi:DNA primase
MRGSASELHGANGLTTISDREVWVRDDVDDAQAVKTLTHELAHIMLHTRTDQPASCAGIREIEAESVAHLVMATYGVRTATYSFPYVASWAHPLAAAERVSMTDIVARTGARVTQAAAEIIEVTNAAAVRPPEPATAALTARVAAATERASELRERAAVSLLPSVDRATLLGVVADSQDYFRRQLPHSWAPGYLAQRGLDAAIDSHSVGYAPKSWTALTDHLRTLGYTDDHIEASGMATRARTGHLIDRFRDRLTFPLHDRDGDLVGFTGRSAPHTSDTDCPKYLNCPTTAIFRKSEVLYGYAAFARSTSESVPVVCEGPLDAVAIDLLASGEGPPMKGLASIGTAFTEHHARQLLAVVEGRRICLAFDGDSAGHTAAEAAWRRLTDSGPYDVRLAELPEGADPASLARSELLAQVLDSARPATTVVASRTIEAAGPDRHVAWEVAAFRSLSQLTTRMPIEQRSPFLLDLALRLRIDPGDAATIAVDQNPAILMEKIADRAHDLAVVVRSTTREPLDQDAHRCSLTPPPQAISR